MNSEEAEVYRFRIRSPTHDSGRAPPHVCDGVCDTELSSGALLDAVTRRRRMWPMSGRARLFCRVRVVHILSRVKHVHQGEGA
jgi:hypothetical protein